MLIWACVDVTTSDPLTFSLTPFHRPDDRDDGYVQRSSGIWHPVPGLPDVRRADLLPGPPRVAPAPGPGRAGVSPGNRGAGPGAALQPAQQQALPHQGNGTLLPR